MSFHVGQRVVCMDDQWHGGGAQSRSGVQCPLRRGSVYTVRMVYQSYGIYTGRLCEYQCLELTEVKKPYCGEIDYTPGFAADRFRPLDERRLDVFRSMLVRPPREKVDA